MSFADSASTYGYGLASVFRYSDGVGVVKLGEEQTDPAIGATVTRPNSRGDVAYGGLGTVTYVSDTGFQQLISSDPWLDLAVVNGINDAGTIIYGYTSSYRGYQGYTVGGAWNFDNGPVDMAPMRWGSALNNRGDIAGTGSGSYAAIRWADGTVTKIDEPGFATALNDRGVAGGAVTVVTAPDGLESYRDPWVFDTTGGRRLNDLIDPALGWTLWYASDINNAGQIAGTGFVNGQRHAFRLTPVNAVPEPGSLSLFATALVPLVIWRRRAKTC
ncbi:MAG TPA: PEP-CTERM sorting domain-containing protein [Armatimonadota bacterium]